jgi:hypothetical protein
MRRERTPDEGYRALIKRTTRPESPTDAAVWAYVVLGEHDDIAERVVDLYHDEFEREQVQAWIIAGADDKRISRDLGIAIFALPTYRRLCCCISNFRDRLELLRWIHNYGGTHQGKLLLEKAIHHHGVEALAHMHGLASTLDPEDVQKQVMRESYFRGIGTHRSTKLGSTESSAASAAMKTAAAAALALGGGGESDLNSIVAKLKLKFREETKAAGAAVPREEILH